MAASDIERLVVRIEANAVQFESQLKKMNRAMYGAANENKKSLNKIERDMRDTARRAFDPLIARSGVVGDAFKGMGTAGGIAAGAIGAIAIAAGAAAVAVRQIAQAADDLETAADVIGITSEQLQRLRYAADETDVPIQKMEDNLRNLNNALGAYKLGIGDARIRPVFEALGITRADLAGVEDSQELLRILADRLGQVQSRGEQVRLARALGIEELLPLLRRGTAGLDEMSAAADRLGLVVDNRTVNALATANRQFQVFGEQARVAATQGLSPLTIAAGDVAEAIGNMISAMSRMQGETPGWVRALRLSTAALTPVRALIGAREYGRLRGAAGQNEALAPDLADRVAEMFGPQQAGFETTPRERGGGGGASNAANQARQRQRRFEDMIAQAMLANFDAMQGEYRAREEILAFAETRLDMEREAAQVARERQVVDGELTRAQADELAAIEEQTYAARVQNLRDRDAMEAAAEAARVMDAIADANLEALGLSLEHVSNARDRVALERQMLEQTRALGRERLARELELNQNLSDAQREAQLAAYDRVTGAQLGAFDQRAENEMRESFRNAFSEGMRAAIEGNVEGFFLSLADRFTQRILDNLADDLFNILNNALGGGSGGGGGILSSIFGAVGGLFGRATGGAVRGGQPYIVGEKRPEVFVPNGNGMILPRVPAGGAAPVQNFYVNAQGAVLADGLMREMRAYSAQVSGLAADGAYRAAKADTLSEMTRRDRNRLGRN